MRARRRHHASQLAKRAVCFFGLERHPFTDAFRHSLPLVAALFLLAAALALPCRERRSPKPRSTSRRRGPGPLGFVGGGQSRHVASVFVRFP
jgi:hypothetical protein